MGRKTYELAVRLGERFTEKKCDVFSKNIEQQHSAQENVIFISDPGSFTKQLIKSPGKDIFLEGGGEIVSLFSTKTWWMK
jgi:dihydrofolate reductase